jgi:hypothetical protein
MLAPLIFDMLFASLVLLLFGWASDAFRASTHAGHSYLHSNGPSARDRMTRPRQALPHDGREATRTAEPVWRHQPPARLASYGRSIERLLSQAPEPQKCH